MGEIETKTWGEVEIGWTVRDKNDRLWVVVESSNPGTVAIRGSHPQNELIVMPRPADDKPVDVYIATEAEALNIAHEVLGTRMLRQIEETQHTLARALNWRVDPVPRKVQALRDHIDWLHGVNVDDVLRQHNGTPANPSDAATKKASIAELCAAHDEMHDRPDLWPHNYAHHHARIGE